MYQKELVTHANFQKRLRAILSVGLFCLKFKVSFGIQGVFMSMIWLLSMIIQGFPIATEPKF